MTESSIFEILIYAFWCWASYGLMMGSFMISTYENKQPMTLGHIIVAVFVSMFGVYSFIFCLLRTFLIHKTLLPLSWNMYFERSKS